MPANSTIHPFQLSGLGLAPFRCVGVTENVYSACSGHQQPGGTCDFCGTGIRYCCQIVSADGKRFVVGVDCVRKLDREDNRLTRQADHEMAKIAKAKRDAKRAALAEQQRAAREAELQAQRDRNGGFTDREVAANERAQREAECAAKAQAENKWLLDVLAQINYESSFVASMESELSRRPLRDLSDRCRNVLRDIYAKIVSGSRRNSKAYNEASDRFDDNEGCD